MAKTQGSIIELIDKNLRAWRSHFSSREKVSFIYAKIVKGKEQTAKVMVMIARRMRWSISSATVSDSEDGGEGEANCGDRRRRHGDWLPAGRHRGA